MFDDFETPEFSLSSNRATINDFFEYVETQNTVYYFCEHGSLSEFKKRISEIGYLNKDHEQAKEWNVKIFAFHFDVDDIFVLQSGNFNISASFLRHEDKGRFIVGGEASKKAHLDICAVLFEFEGPDSIILELNDNSAKSKSVRLSGYIGESLSDRISTDCVDCVTLLNWTDDTVVEMTLEDLSSLEVAQDWHLQTIEARLRTGGTNEALRQEMSQYLGEYQGLPIATNVKVASRIQDLQWRCHNNLKFNGLSNETMRFVDIKALVHEIDSATNRFADVHNGSIQSWVLLAKQEIADIQNESASRRRLSFLFGEGDQIENQISNLSTSYSSSLELIAAKKQEVSNAESTLAGHLHAQKLIEEKDANSDKAKNQIYNAAKLAVVVTAAAIGGPIAPVVGTALNVGLDFAQKREMGLDPDVFDAYEAGMTTYKTIDELDKFFGAFKHRWDEMDDFWESFRNDWKDSKKRKEHLSELKKKFDIETKAVASAAKLGKTLEVEFVSSPPVELPEVKEARELLERLISELLALEKDSLEIFTLRSEAINRVLEISAEIQDMDRLKEIVSLRPILISTAFSELNNVLNEYWDFVDNIVRNLIFHGVKYDAQRLASVTDNLLLYDVEKQLNFISSQDLNDIAEHKLVEFRDRFVVGCRGVQQILQSSLLAHPRSISKSIGTTVFELHVLAPSWTSILSKNAQFLRNQTTIERGVFHLPAEYQINLIRSFGAYIGYTAGSVVVKLENGRYVSSSLGVGSRQISDRNKSMRTSFFHSEHDFENPELSISEFSNITFKDGDWVADKIPRDRVNPISIDHYAVLDISEIDDRITEVWVAVTMVPLD